VAALGAIVRRVQLADVGDGGQRQLLTGHNDRVFAVAFARDGKSLASAGGDGVRCWDAATGEATAKIDRSEGVLALEYSPDGKQLAFGGHDRAVTLWDLAAGKESGKLVGHRSYITCLAFSPDGKRMSTGDRDFEVRLWDLAAEPPAATETIKAREISTVIFTPGKFELAFGTRGPDGANLGEVILWRKAAPLVLPLPQFPRQLSLSPDGRLLAAACRDFTVRLWSLGDEVQPQGIFREHGEEVYAVAFSPDGKLLASGGNDNQALIWDAATRKVRQTLIGHVGRVTGVAWSPDGRTLATSSNDKTVRLWDVGR
jgi:WD40 repeat protein